MARTSDEPVVGWRHWGILGRAICSCIQHDLWVPNQRFETVCRWNPYESRMDPDGDTGWSDARIHGKVKNPGHHCGVHAWKDGDRGEVEPSMHSHETFVVGKVSLWGRVYEHQRGYRGEFAYPAEFHIHPETSPRVRGILAQYGVPIIERYPEFAPRLAQLRKMGAPVPKQFCFAVGGPAHMHRIDPTTCPPSLVLYSYDKPDFQKIHTTEPLSEIRVTYRQGYYDKVRCYIYGKPAYVWVYRDEYPSPSELKDVTDLWGRDGAWA